MNAFHACYLLGTSVQGYVRLPSGCWTRFTKISRLLEEHQKRVCGLVPQHPTDKTTNRIHQLRELRMWVLYRWRRGRGGGSVCGQQPWGGKTACCCKIPGKETPSRRSDADRWHTRRTRHHFLYLKLEQGGSYTPQQRLCTDHKQQSTLTTTNKMTL